MGVRTCTRREATGGAGNSAQLDAEPDDDERERDVDSPRLPDKLQPHGEVGHVEGAGRLVQQAQADQEERATDRPLNQIAVGRAEGAPTVGHGDQGIHRQRADFEEHEDVEGVPVAVMPSRPVRQRRSAA